MVRTEDHLQRPRGTAKVVPAFLTFSLRTTGDLPLIMWRFGYTLGLPQKGRVSPAKTYKGVRLYGQNVPRRRHWIRAHACQLADRRLRQVAKRRVGCLR